MSVSPTSHSQSFGPSAIVPGSAYLLLRLSALECLTSFADAWPTMPSADFCPAVRRPLGRLSRPGLSVESTRLRRFRVADVPIGSPQATGAVLAVPGVPIPALPSAG